MKRTDSLALQHKLILQLLYLRRYSLPAALFLFLLMITLGSVPGQAKALSSIASDKLLHFTAYSVLSLLLYTGTDGSRWQRAMKTILAIALMGLMDETIQYFLHYRNSDAVDWLFNMLAATLNVTVYSMLPPLTSALPNDRAVRRLSRRSFNRTN